MTIVRGASPGTPLISGMIRPNITAPHEASMPHWLNHNPVGSRLSGGPLIVQLPTSLRPLAK